MNKNSYDKLSEYGKQNDPVFVNAEEALAFYLQGASNCVAKAAAAIKSNNIEARSRYSDKAILIFSTIIGVIADCSATEMKKVKHLIDYLHIMNEMIIRMNIKNDLELAESIVIALDKMSNVWQDRALLCSRSQDQQGVTAI